MPVERLIKVGSTVLVRSGATISTLTIAYSASDASLQTVSKSSPVGRALLGRKPLDRVTVETPSGQRVYEIVDVLST